MTAQPFDFLTQMKVMHRLSDTERRLISLNLAGGFQTNMDKARWDAAPEAHCEHCGLPDTHGHRLLACPHFEHVRAQHPEAISILQTHSSLLWLPVTTIHPQQALYYHPRVNAYTYGTCGRPKEPNNCRAAWAVIQHCRHAPKDHSFDDFAVLQTSHVKGSQTINRAELEAVVCATPLSTSQKERLLTIFADSAFVVQVNWQDRYQRITSLNVQTSFPS